MSTVLQAQLEVLPSRLQLVAVTGPGQGRAGLLSTLAATHSTILDIEYLAASSTTQVPSALQCTFSIRQLLLQSVSK